MPTREEVTQADAAEQSSIKAEQEDELLWPVRAPKFLPENPTPAQLGAFLTDLCDRTPGREVTLGWIRETLHSLPLPVKPEKEPYLVPTARHYRLTTRLVKMRRMAAWLTQDIREAGYWKNPEVRAGMGCVVAGLLGILSALESASWKDGDVFHKAEEGCITQFYADAKAIFFAE